MVARDAVVVARGHKFCVEATPTNRDLAQYCTKGGFKETGETVWIATELLPFIHNRPGGFTTHIMVRCASKYTYMLGLLLIARAKACVSAAPGKCYTSCAYCAISVRGSECW